MRSLFNRPYLLLTLAVLFWSGNIVLGRAVHAEVPPVALAFSRWLGGFLIILGFAWQHLKQDWPVVRRHWRILLLLSALGVGAFNTMLYIGLHSTTAINALLMQSTMPVIIVILSFLFFRDKVTGRQALGIVTSLLGALIIIARADVKILMGLSFRQGDLWIITAVVCYSAYATLLRQRPVLHPLTFLAVTFAAGLMMLVPFWLWEMRMGRVLTLNRPTLLAIGYVAIFPSIISYLFFNRGIELVGANRGGLFFHLIPVFGTIMALLFLGERLMGFQVIGIGLILAGIYVVTRTRARDEPTGG